LSKARRKAHRVLRTPPAVLSFPFAIPPGTWTTFSCFVQHACLAPAMFRSDGWFPREAGARVWLDDARVARIER
jgi:hypothetical protein